MPLRRRPLMILKLCYSIDHYAYCSLRRVTSLRPSQSTVSKGKSSVPGVVFQGGLRALPASCAQHRSHALIHRVAWRKVSSVQLAGC